MARKPVPRPSILDQCEAVGVRDGRMVWRTRDGRIYYTWDSLHGELEAFNRRGRHLGAVDPMTGVAIKPAVRGRRINV